MDRLLKKCVTSVAGADYVEARIHRARGAHVTYVGKELEGIGESTALGGCVRVLVNGAWGFCSFNDINNMEK
ncbi:MAG: PmbA/TldA family metallopeptidase [Alphaproteobacteria bacterium]